MSSQVEKITNIFQSVAQIPLLTGAWIVGSKSHIMIDSSWTQRNIIRNKMTKFRRTYFLDNNYSLCSMGFAEKNNELLVSNTLSNSGRAVITQSEVDTKDAKEKAKQFVEIWKNGQLEKCFDVGALDVHGEIYCDTEFSTLEWSPCEKKLLYIAEKKPEKVEPFFKVKAQGAKDDGVKHVKGGEYEFREEWGENLVGKVKSVLVTLDIDGEESLSLADSIPEYLCPGQAQWCPDGSIVGIAWDTRPRKLGLIYCSNRTSYVFKISPKGEFSILSESDKAVRSPRLSPDGKWLIWIQRETGGPHLATHCIMKLAWPPVEQSRPVTVLGSVQNSIEINNGKRFYGFYGLDFPKRCWFSNKELLFSTVQLNEVKSYILNIETCSLSEITCSMEGNYAMGSLSILDVKDGIVCSSWSSIKSTSQLLIGKLNQESAQISWVPVSQSIVVPGLENHFVEYLKLEHKNDEEIKSFEAIYYGKQDAKNQPLLVWPHGGPHSAFTNSFSSVTAFFSLLGFSIVQVNYRGSIGQGQASIDFLLGRVGDSDVRDCKLATDMCVQLFNCSPDQCVLFGGSHGGFLVTHLSGQYPNDYRAVAARNAVTDISSMVWKSDIPDWCTVEIGEQRFSEEGPVDPKILERMRIASPIAYAHKVKAPTLLMVGSKDLRVPPSQSIQYYNRLKANNVPLRMLIYEDNHPLAKPPVEIDCLINSGIWLTQHAGIEV